MKALSMKLTFVGCLQVIWSSMSEDFVSRNSCVENSRIFALKPVTEESTHL